MKSCDVTKLADKISREYGFNRGAAQVKAVEALEMCPPALAENLKEYTESKPLTDIYIGKYSLPMILALWNSNDFLRALEVITEYSNGNKGTAELKIWSMWR